MYKLLDLKKETSEQLNKVFKNNLTSKLLNKNMWIGGGFARLIGRHVLLEKSSDVSLNIKIKKYLSGHGSKSPGDIDFFTEASNLSVIENIKSSERFFDSIFAKNASVNLFPDSYKEFPIQVVTKFLFNNFEECLESFDLINSKYLLFKERGNYRLLYHKDAPFLDGEGIIEISHCNSPFLFKRLNKYKRFRYLNKIGESARNKNIIKDFLFKTVTNYWEKNFCIMYESFLEDSIKALNNSSSFTNENLCILIGKYDHIECKAIPKSYGYYLSQESPVDWATFVINNNHKGTKL